MSFFYINEEKKIRLQKFIFAQKNQKKFLQLLKNSCIMTFAVA